MTLDTMLDQLEAECTDQKLPKDIRALQLLQMEYRGEIVLTHTQRRAAIACLQFESPKLGVVATTTMNADDFAAMLDKAIERSGIKLIEHRQNEGAKPSPAPIPPHGTPRQGPTPDRRFRRA
jgi:hypothetical protein